MAVSEPMSVFGVYPHFRALRTSVDVLKSFGFRNEEIGVLFPERAVASTFSFDNQLKNSQSGDFVRRIEPVIEPLIGGPWAGLPTSTIPNRAPCWKRWLALEFQAPPRADTRNFSIGGNCC